MAFFGGGPGFARRYRNRRRRRFLRSRRRAAPRPSKARAISIRHLWQRVAPGGCVIPRVGKLGPRPWVKLSPPWLDKPGAVRPRGFSGGGPARRRRACAAGCSQSVRPKGRGPQSVTFGLWEGNWGA